MKKNAIFCAAAMLACAGVSYGQTILTVNVSDPSAVVFAATGEPAALDVTDAVVSLTLLDFETGAGFDSLGGPGLSADGADPFAFGINGGTMSYVLGSSAPPTANYSTTSPALTGSAIADLSDTGFPAVGTVADIQIAVSGEGFVVDQYAVVVPEPTSALALFGTAGLLGIRRRR
ncbi:MAG: PEP-CTERM sorting domain-containing protein [Planctomycetota bacterium]